MAGSFADETHLKGAAQSSKRCSELVPSNNREA